MLLKAIKKLFKLLSPVKSPVKKSWTSYHIPESILTQKYYDVIHADIRFSVQERKDITKAVEAWNLFFNNFMILELVFDFDPTSPYLSVNQTALHRCDHTHPMIQDFNKTNKCDIIGLCKPNKITGTKIFLVHNKIDEINYIKNIWQNVAMHEIGHHIWLPHNEERSIMYPYGSELISVNEADAKAFAKKYEINVEDLVYSFIPEISTNT